MVYFCAIAAAIGLYVIAAGRYKVQPEPMCPNCRRSLENFEVDRCPYCLLWMPPGLDRPRTRWRVVPVAIGACLLFTSVCMYAISRTAIFTRLAAGMTTTAPAPAIAPGPTLPLGTPRIGRTIVGLGYTSRRNSPIRAGGPTTLPGATPEEVEFYKDLGVDICTTAPGTIPPPPPDDADDAATDDAAQDGANGE